MKMSKAYDLPIRIFHWSFAVLFVFSFFIAKVIDDDSALYAYHMLSGIMMVGLLIFRIIWGFLGSETVKFSSFKLSFEGLRGYFSSIFSSESKRYLGHNPASSFAAIFMFLFAFGLGLSGLMMSLRINKHFFEEIHELFGNGFLLIAIIHVVGVFFHQLKYRDGMVFSMIHGKKKEIIGESEIASNRPFTAIILVGWIILMGFFLNNNFDIHTGKLSVFGANIQLGENESKEHERKYQNYEDGEEEESENDDN